MIKYCVSRIDFFIVCGAKVDPSLCRSFSRMVSSPGVPYHGFALWRSRDERPHDAQRPFGARRYPDDQEAIWVRAVRRSIVDGTGSGASGGGAIQWPLSEAETKYKMGNNRDCNMITCITLSFRARISSKICTDAFFGATDNFRNMVNVQFGRCLAFL